MQEQNPTSTIMAKKELSSTPFAIADRIILFGRWLVIIASGAMSCFGGFGGPTLANPVIVLIAMILFNLYITIFIQRKHSFVKGENKLLILIDLIQAIVTTTLTGGFRSFYFILFILATIEIALTFPWRISLMALLGVSGLEISAMTVGEFPASEPFAIYLIIGKFTLTLLTGGLVIALDELMHREEIARAEAAKNALQASALNNVLIQLGESGLNINKTLSAILAGTRQICNATFGMVLLPNASGNEWRVAACDAVRDCLGEIIYDIPKELFSIPYFYITKPNNFIPFITEIQSSQVIGIPLRIQNGNIAGILISGWEKQQNISQENIDLLQALARVAAMALRNASLYEQEQKSIQQLRHFEQARSTFFSAIGHELKTPLTVLKMLVPSLYQWSELPPNAQHEMAQTINENIERMETLIADWLESARLEAGFVQLHRQSINLGRICQNVINGFDVLTSQKQIQIRLVWDENLPTIQGDRQRLEQVISNLLSNAIKFSPSNSTILVKIENLGEEIKLCVEDNGPGVALVDRERIFDKFYTAVENSSLAGAGLGLYVCREFVHLHGGHIWMENRKDRGSCFCFTIPINSSEEAEYAQSSE